MDNMQLNKHISGQFNTELETIRTQVMSMGGLVEQQLTDAIRAMHDRDENLARRVIQDDAKVNMMEVSIDEPLNVDWDGNELLLSDILGTDEDVIYRGIENEVERKLLMNAVSKLSNREKTIVRLRFGLGTPDGQEMTQKEVASFLGISQSYISRLEKKIMRQLKKEISLHI